MSSNNPPLQISPEMAMAQALLQSFFQTAQSQAVFPSTSANPQAIPTNPAASGALSTVQAPVFHDFSSAYAGTQANTARNIAPSQNLPVAGPASAPVASSSDPPPLEPSPSFTSAQPIQPYISPRVPPPQGHPSITQVLDAQAGSVSPPSSGVSFSGMQSLGYCSLVSHANRNRLASSSCVQSVTHGSCQASTSRARQQARERERGLAIPVPVVPDIVPRRPMITNAFYVDDTSQEQRVRLRCQVLPPIFNGGQIPWHNLKKTLVSDFLEKMCLLYDLELSVETTFKRLVDELCTRMSSSWVGWVFPEQVSTPLGNRLPQMSIVEFSNAGRQYRGNGVWMQKTQVDANASIREIAGIKSIGVDVASHVIVDGARFLICLALDHIIPSVIWREPWIPPVAPTSGITELIDFPEHVFQLVYPQRERAPWFKCEGIDIEAAAQHLLLHIKGCMRTGDYSFLLSPRNVVEVQTGVDTAPSSFGIGVKAELLSAAWASLQNNHGQFFSEVVGGFCTPAMSMPMLLSGTISPDCLEAMAIFGALTGLMVLHGHYPDPLGPLFLQFALHNGNLIAFRDHGCQGDISDFDSFFINFMPMQIETICNRSPASHNAALSLMLYRAAIGSEPPLHPEMQAFLKAFRLPAAHGFDLVKAIRTFASGTSGYLSVLSTSHVKSSDNLGAFIHIAEPFSYMSRDLSDMLSQTFRFVDLWKEFLSGTGIPVPTLWEEVKGSFHTMINLDSIDQPYFRPQMFLWSVTGSPRLRSDLADSQIKVALVGDNNNEYCSDAELCALMIRNGHMSLRTCA
ncbi:hypothetical protein K435DRAFT_849595 [Dendrothele bispora CBS 962.96]|uniref:Uncharacterized protein n=1 Tax=Dendrothele bispora (strain CBS 962.96) TaxID=1314807 RepID=A0A4S8MRV2_DENBC|nr:hypothetical protein K435DRAFT_849595 [Dendrothele bispora CBS 962.96]